MASTIAARLALLDEVDGLLGPCWVGWSLLGPCWGAGGWYTLSLESVSRSAGAFAMITFKTSARFVGCHLRTVP